MQVRKFLLLLIVVTGGIFPRFSLPLSSQDTPSPVIVGAERTGQYFPKLEGNGIGVVVNHTAMVDTAHLVDTLLRAGIDVQKIFAPEHGFRGTASAGAKLNDQTDPQTGLPIISLYGKKRKPTQQELSGIDIMVFDIQDVGVRFYTYISTLHNVMEACAQHDVPLLVLDRPNPNGHYIDGPVLQPEYRSFVGKHPVPLVHGMTMAEYARMINGQYWLRDSMQCDLRWVKCKNYDHTTFYTLPKKPSPNLPNMKAVYLYPSLGLFEGTIISVGRGTKKPFQVIGHPEFAKGEFCFVPISLPGATDPPYKGKMCCGYDFSKKKIKKLRQMKLNLSWLLETFRYFDRVGDTYFNDYFNKLAGNATLQKRIKKHWNAQQIRSHWDEDLKDFQQIRQQYLLYPDFDDQNIGSP